MNEFFEAAWALRWVLLPIIVLLGYVLVAEKRGW